ncbi:hypothetical protein ACOMHN_009361 [Nucella lapillus]
MTTRSVSPVVTTEPLDKEDRVQDLNQTEKGSETHTSLLRTGDGRHDQAVDDDCDVCDEDTSSSSQSPDSVCHGVSVHRITDPCKETVTCRLAAASAPTDSCPVATERTAMSSDMSDGSSSVGVDVDSSESGGSANKDGSDSDTVENGQDNETAEDGEKSHGSSGMPQDRDMAQDGVTARSSDMAQDGVTAHSSDTAQNSDKTEDGSNNPTHHNPDPAGSNNPTTNQPDASPDPAPDLRPQSGPHRRPQTARPQRRPTPLRRLNLPPAVLAQWRAVGRQWGAENDDDIARVLMRHYEDVVAGRPPRPPPHGLCPDCGEAVRPVPCPGCGPHQHSFRLGHHSGGGHSSGGKGSSCCP